MPHEIFMREAIAISRESVHKCGGGPFGAVIVKDGHIIGRGANCVTTDHDPTAHAEISAIRDACKALGTFTLAGCTIYSSCEPCPMCLSAIYWARLDKIFYANTQDDAARIDFDDAFLYREISLPMAQRSVPITQILYDEAITVFDEWARKTDRTMY